MSIIKNHLKKLYSETYTLGRHWYAFRESWFIRNTSSDRLERILDAGSGNAWVLEQFKKRKIEIDYIAVDLAIGDPNTAYRMNALADLHRLPFHSNSFDKVICNSVLEHVDLPEVVLQEIARVTRPGGIIYLHVPMMWHLHQEPFDFHRFTLHKIRRVAETNNLNIVKIQPMGGYFTVVRYLLGNYSFAFINSSRLWKFFTYPMLYFYRAFERTLGAPLFRFLDSFDEKKNLTIGYFVELSRSGNEEAIVNDPYRCPKCNLEQSIFTRLSESWICNSCFFSFPLTRGIPDLNYRGNSEPLTENIQILK